jgi:hypothetical protein
MYGAHLRADRAAATKNLINLNRDRKNLPNLDSTNNLYRTKGPRRAAKCCTRDVQAISFFTTFFQIAA